MCASFLPPRRYITDNWFCRVVLSSAKETPFLPVRRRQNRASDVNKIPLGANPRFPPDALASLLMRRTCKPGGHNAPEFQLSRILLADLPVEPGFVECGEGVCLHDVSSGDRHGPGFAVYVDSGNALDVLQSIVSPLHAGAAAKMHA